MSAVRSKTRSRDMESRRTGIASRAWPLALASVLLLAACGGGGGGAGGATSGDGYDGDNEVTVPDPTLASIQENVFTPVCTACHMGASAPQGLRLEAGLSYAMLVNVASSEVPSLDRVEPGNPDDSYLIRKLEGTASVGSRMPLGGPYLSNAVISAIRQWITDGALETTALQQKSAGLVAAWPVPGSSLDAAPDRLIVAADRELDLTRISAYSVQLLRVEASQVSQVAAEIGVTSMQPTVLEIRPVETLVPGNYEIRVAGEGSHLLLDLSGLPIDGNGDGIPGGDFHAAFEVLDR